MKQVIQIKLVCPVWFSLIWFTQINLYFNAIEHCYIFYLKSEKPNRENPNQKPKSYFLLKLKRTRIQPRTELILEYLNTIHILENISYKMD